MNQSWLRQRELYNRALGRFMSRIIFKPEEWMSKEDRLEYTTLQKGG